jgi:hypothetical protein
MEGMTEARSYYVYALKDPCKSPAEPFYVGKGTGSRVLTHPVDSSAKGMRIKDIRQAALKVLLTTLAANLTEIEALRIEAELISAFGTEALDGKLTNVITPSTAPRERRLRNLIIPSGAIEKSQISLQLLKESVLELVRANNDGVTNADVAHTLGIQSHNNGKQKDYLSYSVLGLLMHESLVRRDEHGRYKA